MLLYLQNKIKFNLIIIFFIKLICIANLEQENSRNYLKPDFLKISVKTINAAIDLIGMTDQRYPGFYYSCQYFK